MNTIDIVIPTMWCDEDFIPTLEKYCSYSSVGKIILIDNQKSKRPNHNILQNSKIELVCYNKNIFVNPAWNEGYYRSSADVIAVLNDDIFVDEKLFNIVQSLDINNIDIIGSCLRGTISNYEIQDNYYEEEKLVKLELNKKRPIGGQSYAFGVCMFIKRSSYKPIPSLYKIWFGDDYIVQRCNDVYVFKTNHITGKISKTVSNSKIKNLDNRIALDAHNAYHYKHFRNVKNWEVVVNSLSSKKYEKFY